MKFRFLSAKKRRQRTGRDFGAILLLTGLALWRLRGAEDLLLVGLLFIIWSGMSWFAYQGDSNKQISVWWQIAALIGFIVLVGICTVLVGMLVSFRHTLLG